MAPEQFLNFRDIKPPADLYSMGAALYHMLTGQLANSFRREAAPYATIIEEDVIPVWQPIWRPRRRSQHRRDRDA